MERVVFDSDLYLDWIYAGSHGELLLGGWFVRYMSTVVLPELQAGAVGPVGESCWLAPKCCPVPLCEIGLTRATGRIFRSYLYLIEHATRP